MELSKKEEKLLRLAEKGGNDSSLLLLDTIQEVEEKLDMHIEEMAKELEEIRDEIPDLDKVLESIKGKDGKDSEIAGPKGEGGDKGDRGDSIIGPRGPIGPRGEQGERGEDGKNGESIIGLAGKDGKDGSPDTPEQIKDKLESIKIEEEKLRIEAIKDLRRELDELKERSGRMGGRSFGGVLNVGVRIEIPAGDVNTTNTVFFVSKTPKYIVVDGVTYFENNGYTLSGIGGKTLTVEVSPTGFIRSFY